MSSNHPIPEIGRFLSEVSGLPVTVFRQEQCLGAWGAPFSGTVLESLLEWYRTAILGQEGGTDDPRTLQNPLGEDFLDFTVRLDSVRYCFLCGPFLLNRSLSRHRIGALEALGYSVTDERVSAEYLQALKPVDSTGIQNLQFLLHLTRQYLLTDSGQPQAAGILLEHYYRNLISNREAYYHHPPYQLEQQLLEEIRRGNEPGAREIADRLYAHPDARLAGSPIRSYRNSLICRCTLYTRAAIDVGATPEAAFTLSDVMINELERLETVPELYQLDLAMIRSFCRMAAESRSAPLGHLVRRAAAYIDEHLCDRLTLGEIAAALYVHPNYLSALFSKEMGLSVTDYIQKGRIQEAQRLLRYSANGIPDIASFLGFSSQSHFGRVFKACTGQTPYQYRKSHGL